MDLPLDKPNDKYLIDNMDNIDEKRITLDDYDVKKETVFVSFIDPVGEEIISIPTRK
jgi:hypothetical protein